MPAVYLLKQGCAANPLFKNHWALFVPTNGTPESGRTVGTQLHAHGSVAEGFAFEAKRNWEKDASGSEYRFFVIGEVTAASVKASPPITNVILDPEPKTDFERALLKAPPPGPLLKSAQVSNRGKVRAELRNCQTWIREALPHTVEAGYLTLSEEAEGIMDAAER